MWLGGREGLFQDRNVLRALAWPQHHDLGHSQFGCPPLPHHGRWAELFLRHPPSFSSPHTFCLRTDSTLFLQKIFKENRGSGHFIQGSLKLLSQGQSHAALTPWRIRWQIWYWVWTPWKARHPGGGQSRAGERRLSLCMCMLSVRVHAHLCISVCTHVFMFLCACMSICMCTCVMYICVCAHMCTYSHRLTGTSNSRIP